MSEPKPAPAATDAPIDPLFSHAASPFLRTETPAQVAFASPPDRLPALTPMAAWNAYRTPIYFGSAVLAYLMVLVGSVTAVQANPTADWRYEAAALPVIPAGLIVWLTVRLLARTDEVQKRKQVQATGFSLVTTALVTFGYGFLESVGMPNLNLSLVLPLMAALWGIALAVLSLRSRLRR